MILSRLIRHLSSQLQISYLKAKIEAAKNELILQGKLSPKVQRDSVPVIEEEKSGEFTASDSKLSVASENMDLYEQKLADEKEQDNDQPIESRCPSRTSSAESLTLGMLRGSRISRIGPRQGSSEKSDLSASATFSVFNEDGMPSRWKAREIERQKQQEDEDESDETANDENSASASKTDQISPRHSNDIIQRIQALISERESEIDVLEKQTKKTEEETLFYRDKIANMQKEHESNMAAAKRERDALLRGIQRMEEDNEKLEALTLETGVLLQEKEISSHMLETELREARKELYILRGRKREGKIHHRKSSDIDETEICKVPLNDVDEEERIGGRMQRRTSTSSVLSANSVMSALTLDFDDIVDILDSSSRDNMENFDNLLESLTSSNNSPID